MILTLFSLANLYQSSKPFGGDLAYLFLYSRTASSKLVLCLDMSVRNLDCASCMSRAMGCVVSPVCVNDVLAQVHKFLGDAAVGIHCDDVDEPKSASWFALGDISQIRVAKMMHIKRVSRVRGLETMLVMKSPAMRMPRERRWRLEGFGVTNGDELEAKLREIRGRRIHFTETGSSLGDVEFEFEFCRLCAHAPEVHIRKQCHTISLSTLDLFISFYFDKYIRKLVV